MDRIAVVTYSHSSYFDVLRISIALRGMHFSESIENFDFFIAADVKYEDYNTIVYDDKLQYTNRIEYILKLLEIKGYTWILFDHEDMLLIDKPQSGLIDNLVKHCATDNVDSVRLINTSNTWKTQIRKGYFRILKISPWLFSIQPSIWKIKSFLKLVRSLQGKNIWEFEKSAQSKIRFGTYKIDILHRGEEKIGKYHFHNLEYPYVATAIVKGKWNFTEYGHFLSEMLGSDKFCVDENVRGKI